MLEKLNVAQLPDPILIVAPHPDDDVLGTGGLIQAAQRFGKKIYILYVTAGDANGNSVKNFLHKPLLPRWFIKLGYVRHNEAILAEKYLGVPKSHLFFLGFPDSITYNIVTDTNMARVHQSPLTKFNKAAYSFAYVRNAPYSHESILRLVKSVLKEVRPGTIFVTLRQDTNPDHAASNLIIKQAVLQLKINPNIYFYLIHYPGFPNRFGPIRPPAGLNVKNPVTLPLTIREVAVKRKAFSFMRSQASRFYNKYFRQNELFWRGNIGN